MLWSEALSFRPLADFTRMRDIRAVYISAVPPKRESLLIVATFDCDRILPWKFPRFVLRYQAEIYDWLDV